MATPTQARSRPVPGRLAPQRQQRPPSELRPHAQAALVPALPPAEFAALRAEIERDGILSPLDITAAGVVLDGRERLRAAHQLGHTTVPVLVLRPADEIEHMLMRALTRRHLTPSQRAALALDLHAVQQAQAEATARRNRNLRRGTSGPVPATLPERGETRDLAARLAGVSARTAQDALTVRDANPDLFDQVKAGKVAVHLAARRVRRQQRDSRLPPAPPMPDGPFELVYADPPWQLGNPDGPHAPEQHYPTMSLEQIMALQIPAAESAILYLWVVPSLLHEACHVAEAWGFTLKSKATWVKPSIGPGIWVRNRQEDIYIATRGGFRPPEPEDRFDSVIEAARGHHSQKPTVVYQLLERAHPTASKVELFARTTRPGWTSWGNQLPPTDQESDR